MRDYDLNIWADEDSGDAVVVTVYPVEDGDTVVNPIHEVRLTGVEAVRLNDEGFIYGGYDDAWVSLEQAPDWLKDRVWRLL